MVTVASGTFVAVDLADAFIESAIESKGNQAMLAEGVILRINFVNIGRFALGCAVDIGSGARKTTYEFMSIELTTGSMAVAAERTFLHVKKRGSKAEERELIIVDPMLATGGSSSAAIGFLKKRGCTHIRLMCLIAAPEGVKRVQEDHPDVDIYVAQMDDHLNEHGYIVPGLGDAGDRLFGTK